MNMARRSMSTLSRAAVAATAMSMLAVTAAFTVGLAGCGGPTEEECRATCRNVVEVFAAQAKGVTPDARQRAVEAASALATDCESTCRQGDRKHTQCLAAAKTVKDLNECNIPR